MNRRHFLKGAGFALGSLVIPWVPEVFYSIPKVVVSQNLGWSFNGIPILADVSVPDGEMWFLNQREADNWLRMNGYGLMKYKPLEWFKERYPYPVRA